MGLDMYCYRVSRLNEKDLETIKNLQYESEYDKYGFSLFNRPSEHDIDGISQLSDLSPYVNTVMVKEEFIDLSKMKTDFDIPDDADIVGESYGDKYGFIFSNNLGFRVGLEFTDEEFKRYIYEEEVECYVCKMDEVAYWRKNYDLQNEMHRLSNSDILNCGYYILNEDMYEAMIRDGGLDSSENFEDENSALFYHEWY